MRIGGDLVSGTDDSPRDWNLLFEKVLCGIEGFGEIGGGALLGDPSLTVGVDGLLVRPGRDTALLADATTFSFVPLLDTIGSLKRGFGVIGKVGLGEIGGGLGC